MVHMTVVPAVQRYYAIVVILSLTVISLCGISRDTTSETTRHLSVNHVRRNNERDEWLVPNVRNSSTTTTDPVWILALRIQKTGSSTLELFIKDWLEEHGRYNCGLVRSCKTVHPTAMDLTWNDSPPCTCGVMDTMIRENQNNAAACRVINGIHADYVDLTSWFQGGGDCQRRSTGGKSPPEVPHVILTMVRDPVDRVVSEFKFVLRESLARGKFGGIFAWDYGCDRVANLTQYLENDDCQRGSSNRQTRMIAGHGSNDDWQDVYDNSEELILETAKENLRTKIHFGLVEHEEESAQLFRHVLAEARNVQDSDETMEFSSSPVIHARKNMRPKWDLKEVVREKAERRNHLDRELYNFATTLFWKRYCTAFPDVNHDKCRINVDPTR